MHIKGNLLNMARSAKSVVSDLLNIYKSSVSAVLPDNLIREAVQYNPVNQQMTIVNENYNLKNKNIYLIGFGKAVQNMAQEAEKMMGVKIKHGIISIPLGSLSNSSPNTNILYCEGAENNLPDLKAEATALSIRNLVTKLQSDDLLLVLISGGGSALLPLPKAPITLAEKTALIKNLANSGADIKELNTVRKQLSDLKGGQLAIKSQPAQVVGLILSDIVGDPLDLIASGPTVENEDNPSKAIDIIKKFNLYKELPDSIKAVLEETDMKVIYPKENVRNYVIGSSKKCISAAVDSARSMGYKAIGLSNIVTGDIKDVAIGFSKLTKVFCSYFKGELNLNGLKREVQRCNIPGINTDILDSIDISQNKKICLVFGGEITVQVKGSGKGGRNQQLSLEYSNNLDRNKDDFNNYNVYFLSAGTDGIDGPTDAAGAIGYLDLISDAKKENLDVEYYLKQNDSYNFYKKFRSGDFHVITGHTNTNVMDLYIIVIEPKTFCKSVL